MFYNGIFLPGGHVSAKFHEDLLFHNYTRSHTRYGAVYNTIHDDTYIIYASGGTMRDRPHTLQGPSHAHMIPQTHFYNDVQYTRTYTLNASFYLFILIITIIFIIINNYYYFFLIGPFLREGPAAVAINNQPSM